MSDARATQGRLVGEDYRKISGEIYLVAAWFALATAVAHLLFLGYGRFVAHRFIRASRDAVWLIPLGETVYFVAIATAIAIAALFVRRRDVASFAYVAFTFLGVFLTLLLFSAIHQYASLVLAVGVAVFLAQRIPDDRARLRRFFRRSMAVGWVVVAVLGASDHLYRATLESRVLGRVTAAAPDAPNVILLILDTVRASSMSLYGYSRPTTPALERWAQRGVVFDRAIAPSSWTLASHATIFTGQPALRTSARWERPLDGSFPLMTEAFRDQGYRTGGFVANLFYTTYESGLARGMLHLDGYRTSLRELLWSSTIAQTTVFSQLRYGTSTRERLRALVPPDFRLFSEPRHHQKYAADVTDEFLAWQAKRAGRPFFAFLNYFDAHDPYAPPAPYPTRFSATPTEQDKYDGAIAYLDAQVDRLLGELDRRGALANTIVIITSDHGEQFGEHGLKSHGNSLYLPLLHVPMVVLYPKRVPQGIRVPAVVSLRDIGATLFDLTGVRAPAGFPGQSLMTLFAAGQPAVRDAARAEVEGKAGSTSPTGHGDLRGLIDDRYHFIRADDGMEELFAFTSDPAELRNLVADSTMAATAAEYRARVVNGAARASTERSAHTLAVVR
jgi:arylsulfatase A-like enzyme